MIENISPDKHDLKVVDQNHFLSIDRKSIFGFYIDRLLNLIEQILECHQ